MRWNPFLASVTVFQVLRGTPLATEFLIYNVCSGVRDRRYDEGAIVLACNNHPMAPCDGLTKWNSFDNSEGLIPQQVFVHLFLPVDGNWGWCVTCVGFRVLIDVYLHGWTSHAGQRFVRMHIADGVLQPFQEEFLHELIVFLSAWERQFSEG